MKTKVLGLTEFNAFIHLASEQIKEFVLDVIDSNLELKVTSLVNDLLLGHKARGEIFVPFEGMEIVSFKAVFLLGTCYSEFETKLYGLPNFARPKIKDLKILGTFEGHDLYIYPQDGLPDTLVAKYGDGPDQYLSFNPELAGLSYMEVAKIGGIQLELYKRAIGVDAYFKFKAGAKHN